MSVRSRFDRLSEAAGPAVMEQVGNMKFWYSTNRPYRLRREDIDLEKVAEIVRTTPMVRDGDKRETVDTPDGPKDVPVMRAATEEEAEDLRMKALHDFLYVAKHQGGTVVCTILVDPEKGLTISGEAHCHSGTDAFNGKIGKLAARERAICNVLEEHFNIVDEKPEASVPKKVQVENRKKNAERRRERQFAQIFG